jgi:hypothetical protein
VKRVLLDENLPRKLRRELPEFVVRTVQEEQWSSYTNGALLELGQEAFDVLLTADRRLQYQQNLQRFRIGVVVIVTVNLRFRTIRRAIEEIRLALMQVGPGELIQVEIPRSP